MARFVTWHGPAVSARIDGMIKRRLVAAALVVEGNAKRSMTGEKSGKMYLKSGTRVMYQASAPGEPPAVRTAALKNSITHDEPSKSLLGSWRCHVGTDEPYAKFLELGTSKMRPRPFLRPALDKSRKGIKALFRGTPLARGGQ